MSDFSRILIAIFVSVAIVAAVVLLGRRSQKQFALGCGLIFLAAFSISIFCPVAMYSGGSFWGEGYSTEFPVIASLYVIAQVAIWRGFAKPGWLALFLTLPLAFVLTAMGYWKWIA